MHLEVQVALNFVISYLYNKLPRRRVNIFGEELEKALKEKFVGHWYPDKPFKGSAFRCLKTGDPVDAVLERAAKESGVPVQDILENLPSELAVWVDPGEVSYRIGEKGSVKVLFSESDATSAACMSSSLASSCTGVTSPDACGSQSISEEADREVNKTFNPEAQCFRPIDAVVSSLLDDDKTASPLHCSASASPQPKTPPSPAPLASSNAASAGVFVPQHSPQQQQQQQTQQRPAPAPLTFTTATFAQTKFGSTKLKTNSKRANRMSPTEFSNYIKQRALQQAGMHHAGGPNSPGGRSLSPASTGHGGAPPPHLDASYYYYPHQQPQQHHHHYPYVPAAAPGYPQSNSYLEPGASQFYPSQLQATTASAAAQHQAPPSVDKQLVDFGISSQFQHLLVAN